VDAGVNQVGDPVLDSSKRKSLEREAMAKAVEDARLNAETLARAAGAKLGAVRMLNGSASGSPMPVYRRGPMVHGRRSRRPGRRDYQPGEMKFKRGGERRVRFG